MIIYIRIISLVFLCDKDGILYQYFKHYQSLEHHFKKKHFLCHDISCLEKKFTVFRTQIDLQAHELSIHLRGKNLSKSEEKQARRVPLHFNYTTRTEDRRGRGDRFESTTELDGRFVSENMNTSSVLSNPVPQAITVPTITPVLPEVVPQSNSNTKEKTSLELQKKTTELVQTIKGILDQVSYQEFRQLFKQISKR